MEIWLKNDTLINKFKIIKYIKINIIISFFFLIISTTFFFNIAMEFVYLDNCVSPQLLSLECFPLVLVFHWLIVEEHWQVLEEYVLAEAQCTKVGQKWSIACNNLFELTLIPDNLPAYFVLPLAKNIFWSRCIRLEFCPTNLIQAHMIDHLLDLVGVLVANVVSGVQNHIAVAIILVLYELSNTFEEPCLEVH